jgi:uncharacterized membrane protein (UPF0182 family)
MRKTIGIIAGLIVAIFIVIQLSSVFLTDLMWFQSVGYAAVFSTSVLTTIAIRTLVFLLFFLFFWANMQMAWRAIKSLPTAPINFIADLKPSAFNRISLAASLLLALLLSGASALNWQMVQQFLHPVTVGVKDPVFQLDLGYYFFRYPLFQRINGILQNILFVTLIVAGAIYYFSRAYWSEGLRIVLCKPAKIHLTILTVLLFLTKIWGYTLGKQELLFTPTGMITGVDYTAVHARLFAYNALILIASFCIAALIIGLFRRGLRLFLGGVATLIVSSFILGTLVPPLMEQFIVRPNQFSLEEPYIKRHIQETRRAFGLDRIKVREFKMGDSAPLPDLNEPSMANLRLWDYRALHQTYEQLQTIGSYYVFGDIDIDRYQINGQSKQVLLSARELDPNKLPANARNWVNLHLTYTHGYGLAMNGVREVNNEGQPVFMVGNFPTEVAPGLPQLERPQIYFGESRSDYIVAPNLNGEFDYPAEDGENQYHYTGKDGVPLNTLWNRILFASRFGELNFLLTKYIDPQRSKVLFYRRIQDRLTRIAPFLTFDEDPYLVMAEGRLYWIVDAYTTSSYYPYAEYHANQYNYIRNSVKAVVDAYDGTMTLYTVDTADPILRAWQRIFPGLFKPLSKMPQMLQSHLRYPETLFSVQRDMLRIYHTVSAKAFYDKQDYWDLPTETYTGTQEVLEPYYLTMRLPSATQGEFALFEPFTPNNKKNMIAWLVARCDTPNYGEMHLFMLPKDRVIYGPYQIEGRIAQNPEVSKLLTLWGQGQSDVLRGNLLVIPLEGEFLYVEPFYIQSSQAQQPELKQIVLVYKDQIVLGGTLEEALNQLTGAKINRQTGGTPSIPDKVSLPSPVRIQTLLRQIQDNAQQQQAIFKKQQNLIEQLQKELEKEKQ